MDSRAPVSQTYIHGNLKFVSNNFVAILNKTDVPEAFLKGICNNLFANTRTQLNLNKIVISK